MTLMPFIVGAPRSGTTLLRMMLASHSQLAIPPETGFVAHVAANPQLHDLSAADLLRLLTHFPPEMPAWNDFHLNIDDLRAALAEIPHFTPAEGIRAFYRLYAARHGKARAGDKTPIHGQAMTAIEQFLPEAAFVHVIRDGRAASASLRTMWFSPSEEIGALAAYWRDFVTTCRHQGAEVRRYIEVRFEDLVTDPEPPVRRLCAFLDLSYEAGMLQHEATARALLAEHEARTRSDGSLALTAEQRRAQQWRTTTPRDASRVDAWRTELTDAERAAFWEVAGPLLTELGYRP